VLGIWNPDRDAKFAARYELLTQRHPDEKVLVFTQFADTVRYLTEQLKARGIPYMAHEEQCYESHYHYGMSGPQNMRGSKYALLRKRRKLLVRLFTMVASELAEPTKGHFPLLGELLNCVDGNGEDLARLERQALNCRFLQSIGPVHPASNFTIAVTDYNGARFTRHHERRVCKIGRR
jgi:hypothetical protein